MAYQLTLIQKPTYLHVIVTGENSKESVLGYLSEIRRECTARSCFRVLVEERLEGPRFGIMDVFRIAEQGSRLAGSIYKAFAFVDVNAKGDSMRFAETVGVNRGLPIAVFATVAEAEAWLLKDDPATGAPADRPDR